MIKKAAAKGIVVNHMDDYLRPINNRLDDEDDLDATGLDGALDALTVATGGAKGDEHPERRQKVKHMHTYLPQYEPIYSFIIPP